MTFKLLLNTQMIWIIFMKILKGTVDIKECQVLIIFDDMIADMLINKKLNLVVTELFIRGRKLNISLVFTTQSYFTAPNTNRLNSSHYVIVKISNKR